MSFTPPTTQLTRSFPENVIPLGPHIELKQWNVEPVPTSNPFTGILSQPMWDKAHSVKSQYQDTFDYAVYDRLFQRFGENQPRGGVIYNTNFKLLNYQSSCSQCHYTFELDTYGRGCVHNCTYCYAKDQLSPYGYWNKPHPFPLNIAEIRNIFSTVFETDKPHRWRDILTRKIPIRIGSMSDSFMWMDTKYRVTREVLKLLSYYDYPYIIFTRSDLVAQEEYLNVLRKDLAAIQFSISGNNETLTRKLEPGAPSVARRLKGLRVLADNGFWTTVRVNPLFPTYPDGYFSNEKSLHSRFGTGQIPRLPLLDIDHAEEFAVQLREAHVPSVLAGFVRLSLRAINALSTATDLDIRSFFHPDYLKAAGEKRYSDSEIAFYYTKLRDVFTKQGIRFSTCYIGNGEKGGG